MTGHEDLDDLGPLEVPAMADDADTNHVKDEIRSHSVIGPLSARFRREPSGFIVSFTHGNRHICDMISKSPPWEATDIKEKVIRILKRDDLFKDKEPVWIEEQLNEYLFSIAGQVETDPAYEWVIVSPVVKEIFQQIDGVRIWPSADRDRTLFEILFRVRKDQTLSAEFTSEQWSSNRASTFNKKYLGCFLKTTVALTSQEWRELRDRLITIAEIQEEETYSFIGDIADQILSEIRKMSFSTSASDLEDFNRCAYAQPSGNGNWAICVHTRFITSVIERMGGTSRSHIVQVAKNMDARNLRMRSSKAIRVGPSPSDVIRCWVFRSEDLGIDNESVIVSDDTVNEVTQ